MNMFEIENNNNENTNYNGNNNGGDAYYNGNDTNSQNLSMDNNNNIIGLHNNNTQKFADYNATLLNNITDVKQNTSKNKQTTSNNKQKNIDPFMVAIVIIVAVVIVISITYLTHYFSTAVTIRRRARTPVGSSEHSRVSGQVFGPQNLEPKYREFWAGYPQNLEVELSKKIKSASWNKVPRRRMERAGSFEQLTFGNPPKKQQYGTAKSVNALDAAPSVSLSSQESTGPTPSPSSTQTNPASQQRKQSLEDWLEASSVRRDLGRQQIIAPSSTSSTYSDLSASTVTESKAPESNAPMRSRSSAQIV